MYCKKCGKKLGEGEFFCMSCGTKAENNELKFAGLKDVKKKEGGKVIKIAALVSGSLILSAILGFCFIFLICVFLFKACTMDEVLSSKEEVIAGVKTALPNAEFIKREEIFIEGDGANDEVGKYYEYYFVNKDIEFTVSNYLYKDELSFKYEEEVRNNYIECLHNEKSAELDALLDKFPMIDRNRLDSSVNIYFTLANYQDFDILSEFLEEYFDIFKDYLPYENKSSDVNFIDITIFINISLLDVQDYNLIKMNVAEDLYIDALDNIKSSTINKLKELYIKNVELGYIEDNTIDNS